MKKQKVNIVIYILFLLLFVFKSLYYSFWLLFLLLLSSPLFVSCFVFILYFHCFRFTLLCFSHYSFILLCSCFVLFVIVYICLRFFLHVLFISFLSYFQFSYSILMYLFPLILLYILLLSNRIHISKQTQE